MCPVCWLLQQPANRTHNIGVGTCYNNVNWNTTIFRIASDSRKIKLQQPANRTHNPQLHTLPTTWKPKHQITQAATICIILSSSWWWAYYCPKHVEHAIKSAINIICCIQLAFYFHIKKFKFWVPITRTLCFYVRKDVCIRGYFSNPKGSARKEVAETLV